MRRLTGAPLWRPMPEQVTAERIVCSCVKWIEISRLLSISLPLCARKRLWHFSHSMMREARVPALTSYC